jgi:hypothetical protein
MLHAWWLRLKGELGESKLPPTFSEVNGTWLMCVHHASHIEE